MPPVAGGPETIFAQPQTTSGGQAGCGCPQIPPVATSDKPDPRRIPDEVSFAWLEYLFSNREARFDGDWNKALVALAHEIDPGGQLKIWHGPAPSPVNPRAPIHEGLRSYRLLRGGTPPRNALPGAPRTGSRGDPNIGLFTMAAIVDTIARSNKYGEPAHGLRKALIRVARFMAGDLHYQPSSGVAPAPGSAAQRVLAESRSAQAELLALLAAPVNGVRPGGPLRRQVLPLWRSPGKDELALDAIDRANAALDVLLSVDDAGRRDGLLVDYQKRIDAGGDDKDPSLYLTLGGVSALVELAAQRSVFGGAAAPNSVEDALACKAFTVLVAATDYRTKLSRGYRNTLRGLVYFGPGSALPDTPQFRTAMAAIILGGVSDADEAKQLADRLFSGNVYYRPAHYHGYLSAPAAPAGHTWLVNGGNPNPDTDRRDVAARNVESFLVGPQRAAFHAAVEENWAVVRQAYAETQAANQALQGPYAMRGDPTNLKTALDRWAAAQPDWNRAIAEPLCPPTGATPRVVIFAKGIHGRMMIKKLYVGVPTVLALVFPEPYDGEGYPIKISSGGTDLALTARPIDETHRMYETEQFVIAPR